MFNFLFQKLEVGFRFSLKLAVQFNLFFLEGDI